MDRAAPERDDLAAEQALFDSGSEAYLAGRYEQAIQVLQEHAGKHPRGRYGPMREKLLTLSLLHAGRRGEARQRIERLRRESPESPLVQELDDAARLTP